MGKWNYPFLSPKRIKWSASRPGGGSVGGFGAVCYAGATALREAMRDVSQVIASVTTVTNVTLNDADSVAGLRLA
jgi:hypothetical protein